MALTKVSYSMIKGAPANVLDYGADPTGAADSTAAFTAAFAVSNMVYVPSGSYDLATTITIPPYGQIVGAGIDNTTITATGNNVAFVLQYWSQLRELKVVKAGTHTTNLIEVGSVTLDAGRAVISDVWVQGAGADGIQLIYGNLGLLQNVVSISNGLNGIRFLAGSGDLNAWTLQGYIDLRGNGNDGLRIEGGTSSGDNLCSKSNFISGVTSQENGQYGVYIGTRSNLVSCYTELNTVADVYIGDYGYGNRVETVEGFIVNNCDRFGSNILYNHNADADYKRVFQDCPGFSGELNNGGWRLNNDSGFAGWMQCVKTAAREYTFLAGGSGVTQNVVFKHETAGQRFDMQMGGIIYPLADNTYSFGLAGDRWSVIYAATGTINTSDGRAKQDIQSIDDAEKRVAQRIKGLIKKFRFKDAVEQKGDEARIHFGVVAQEVAEAFAAEGLDATRYALFCYDEWDEQPEVTAPVLDEFKKETGETKVITAYRAAGNRYGIRYDELLAFVIAAL
jgi:hypothetical protein